MSEHVCLVHYHELGLKGKNRNNFERRLIGNIKTAINEMGLRLEVRRISGRLAVLADTHEQCLSVASCLRKVPGVARVSCTIRTQRNLDDICSAALLALSWVEPFLSFKVNSRRAHTDYPISSMELNSLVGAWLCERLPQKRVQMRSPDAVAHVEVIEGAAYVYSQSQKGIGGLPSGSAGAVVSLLSAGIDSPVATWRIIRRGAIAHCLHFSGVPQTPDTSKHLVREILELLKPTGGVGSLACVDFGDYQRNIALNVPEKLRVLIYRRLMLATACRYAKNVGAKALVTGESLGQVASQTLANIMAVDEVASLPVFRPLIGNDKQEIIDEAKEIGTFTISSQSHEDCCTLFMPRSPETQAKLPEVLDAWASLAIAEWLDSILANIHVEKI
ncbi:MAG: tRNA 4-thiouridine(8) synthase ThiI [Coriobacteriales bacterium]|jgi:thiamine biosynthesis protein ThiI|nr:tRNA 4-thiouridine(8) synthase ThiI [Coriobacteriales bacterium]